MKASRPAGVPPGPASRSRTIVGVSVKAMSNTTAAITRGVNSRRSAPKRPAADTAARTAPHSAAAV